MSFMAAGKPSTHTLYLFYIMSDLSAKAAEADPSAPSLQQSNQARRMDLRKISR